MDTAAKVATFKFPSSELVTNLQLGTLKAMGTHNFINAAVAAFSVLGLDVGIDNDSIHNTIESLTLLPHRMQIGITPVSFCVFAGMPGRLCMFDILQCSVQGCSRGNMG